MTKPSSEKKFVIIACLLLALLTLVAYEPVRHNDFISLDDKEYVVNNPNVTRGITVKSIVWAFTTPHSGNWHSLTWLSHMLDCWLFDLNPVGHHMTSLLLTDTAHKARRTKVVPHCEKESWQPQLTRGPRRDSNTC